MARTLPSLIYFSWVIYRVSPPNPNIKVVYRDSSRHSSGGSKGSGPLHMRYWKWRHRKRPWPEWSNMKSRDRKWRHYRKYVLRMPGSASPPFFLTIVVVQNVPLLMTESSMATGCDVTESDVTGSDVIIPKVDDSPWVWS